MHLVVVDISKMSVAAMAVSPHPEIRRALDEQIRQMKEDALEGLRIERLHGAEAARRFLEALVAKRRQ